MPANAKNCNHGDVFDEIKMRKNSVTLEIAPIITKTTTTTTAMRNHPNYKLLTNYNSAGFNCSSLLKIH